MEERYYDEYRRIQDEHWWFVGRRKGAYRGHRPAARGAGEATLQDPRRRLRHRLQPGDAGRFGEVRGVDPAAAAVAECVRREQDVSVAGESAAVRERRPGHPPRRDRARSRRRPTAARGASRLSPGRAHPGHGPRLPVDVGAARRDLHHMRRYTRRTLERSLDGAGLKRLRTTYFNTLLMPPIAAVRLLGRLLLSARRGQGFRQAGRQHREPDVRVDLRRRSPRPNFNLPFGVSLRVARP